MACIENHKLSLETCNLFRGAFLETFTSVARKERAVSLLGRRVQHLNESVTIFSEEMIRLFQSTDPHMTEEKVCLLMRGVKHDIFNRLVRNPRKTGQEFVSVATKIEKTLEMRIRQ